MRQWTIDAFTAAPFMGNPACVVEPFEDWPEAAWMQALARENNQAETAFLLRTIDPDRFGLRWFTPGMEVPLCGHATLASAHALIAEMGLDVSEVAFDTLSGPLSVARAETGYLMDFPADPPTLIPAPDGLAAALGVTPKEVWAGQYLLAVLENEARVRALEPNLAALRAIGGPPASRMTGAIGVSAAASAGASHDVVSRFFAPGAGVPEDPATGSYHCMASPLFSAKLGRPRLRFHQAYPGRGADLECEHRGERVLLRGEAVTVVEGRLRL
jgi:PhzF family phenazine biosynthesis protein